MACKYYDITISGIDIADATGNTFFPNLNGKVFVKYTDCDGAEQEVGYDTPGTYPNEICADNNELVLPGFYSNNQPFAITLNSTVTEEGNCSTPPLFPCQCITVVSLAGSIPYQYTNCSGVVVSATSPPSESTFTVCGSNPSTSFPKFMTFGVGGVCSDGVNCDVPCLDTCGILFNNFNIIYGYDYTSNISTILNPYFDVAPIGSNDIAHTTNKLWVYSSEDLY
jgi:hypothetical protein